MLISIVNTCPSIIFIWEGTLKKLSHQASQQYFCIYWFNSFVPYPLLLWDLYFWFKVENRHALQSVFFPLYQYLPPVVSALLWVFLIFSVHYLHFLELSIYRVSHWHACLKFYALSYMLSTALYFKFYFAVV